MSVSFVYVNAHHITRVTGCTLRDFVDAYFSDWNRAWNALILRSPQGSQWRFVVLHLMKWVVGLRDQRASLGFTTRAESSNSEASANFQRNHTLIPNRPTSKKFFLALLCHCTNAGHASPVTLRSRGGAERARVP